jgi:hypothetical protein
MHWVQVQPFSNYYTDDLEQQTKNPLEHRGGTLGVTIPETVNMSGYSNCKQRVEVPFPERGQVDLGRETGILRSKGKVKKVLGNSGGR